MSEFLVVIPTVRQELAPFEATIEAIQASFTRPTDFYMLDGKVGKVPALNRALADYFDPGEHQVYVTMDDDIVPPNGWQDKTLEAMEADPRLGIVCPWLGDTPEMADYMGPDSVDDWRELGELRVRYLKPMRHIPGCLLAFRRRCQVDVGPQPATGLKYDIFEDAWRGRRAHKAGWRTAYVDAGPVTMVNYDDPEEFLRFKAEQIEEGRAMQDQVLREGGVSDPFSWRLRRWIARMRGR